MTSKNIYTKLNAFMGVKNHGVFRYMQLGLMHLRIQT